MRDEFPGRAFLLPAQVQKLLGIRNHKEWTAFLAEQPLFPAMVQVGKTPKGKPRMRYPKSKVLAFIDLLGG